MRTLTFDQKPSPHRALTDKGRGQIQILILVGTEEKGEVLELHDPPD